jgi:hypothetical protein
MGQPLYTVPLELVELGCGPMAHDRHFVMALPLGSAVLDAIAGLNVTAGGRVKGVVRAVAAAARAQATPPELRRLDSERVHLTWDATIHPAALVRDTDSGEVIAILRGGSQILGTKARHFDLVLSDGVSGPTHHLETID